MPGRFMQEDELTQDEIDEKNETCADFVLNALRIGEQTTLSLKEEHRFSTGVNMLRKRGYEINSERDGPGCRYALISEPPIERVKVTKAMQAGYYDSSHWAEKRKERREFDGNKCCWCGTSNETLHVHHWKYDLFAEEITDLMTLCVPCHDKIHAAIRKSMVHFPEYVDAATAALLKNCLANSETQDYAARDYRQRLLFSDN